MENSLHSDFTAFRNTKRTVKRKVCTTATGGDCCLHLQPEHAVAVNVWNFTFRSANI
jgi:hypothetical protein